MMDGVTMVLIAAAAVSIVTTIFAVMLLIAERYFANYGICTIKINEGSKELAVQGGRNLLSSLASEKLFIPSACGGRGTCGFCKVKLIEGGGPLLPTEENLLSADEIADEVRISCQVKVRNNLSLIIPEELFNIRQYEGHVESIEDLTYDIKLLRIKLDQQQTITFEPGQYVQLQAEGDLSDQEPVSRAYSIASDPHEDTVVELIIRLVPGGICTTWVFQKLSAGDKVVFNGPCGDFRLSDSNRPMVWIAGGSGMAPFWSMIHHMKRNNIDRKTTYFFGAVQKKDLFFVDELNQLAEELPWFDFVPALSSPADSDQWDGQTGLITEVVSACLEDNSQAEGYLCGSAGMINASVETLKSRGISEEDIFYDKFN